MTDDELAQVYLVDHPDATDGELADAVWGSPGSDNIRSWLRYVSRAERGWRVSIAELRYVAARRIRRRVARR